MKHNPKTHWKNLLVGFTLASSPLMSAYAQWLPTNKIDASDRSAGAGFGSSVALSGNYAFAGAPFEDYDESGLNPLTDAGAVYVYKKNTVGNWVQTQKIVAMDRHAEDWFGTSVSINGNYALVGAFWNDYDAAGLNYLENAGAVYVYKIDAGGIWNFVTKWVAPDRRTGDFFGCEVSISNGNAIVGAYYNDFNEMDLMEVNNAGAAYMYSLNTTTDAWSFTQKLVSGDRSMDDYFGYAVAIHNDRLIIGATLDYEDQNGLNPKTYAGSAYIFEQQSSGTWLQVEKIAASDRDDYDTFGDKVTIYGDYAVVGAYAESEDENGLNTKTRAGSCYVYRRNAAGDWLQVQKLVASDRTPEYYFGNSLSLADSLLLVGSFNNATNISGLSTIGGAGAAYLFSLNSTGIWTENQKIVAWDRNNAYENFGSDVALDWNRAIVGSPSDLEDEDGLMSISPPPGSAFFFTNLSLPTNINSNEENIEITLYPNPTNSILYLDIKEPVVITVYDATGKKVMRYSYFPGHNILNVESLAAGIYQISIENNNHRKTVKIIKTN